MNTAPDSTPKTKEPKPSKRAAAAILRKAANALDEFGWIQKSYGSQVHGFCALGSINHIVPNTVNTPAKQLRNKWLAQSALCQTVGTNWIPDWNDHKVGSKDDVTGAMRKAARDLEHGMQVTL